MRAYSRTVLAGSVSIVALLIGGCSGTPHHAANAHVPGWVSHCLGTLGPVTHDYDGLSVSAAASKAKLQGRALVLAGRNGQCTVRTFNFVPGRTAIVVQGGKVVAARVTN